MNNPDLNQNSLIKFSLRKENSQPFTSAENQKSVDIDSELPLAIQNLSPEGQAEWRKCSRRLKQKLKNNNCCEITNDSVQKKDLSNNDLLDIKTIVEHGARWLAGKIVVFRSELFLAEMAWLPEDHKFLSKILINYFSSFNANLVLEEAQINKIVAKALREADILTADYQNEDEEIFMRLPGRIRSMTDNNYSDEIDHAQLRMDIKQLMKAQILHSVSEAKVAICNVTDILQNSMEITYEEVRDLFITPRVNVLEINLPNK